MRQFGDRCKGIIAESCKWAKLLLCGCDAQHYRVIAVNSYVSCDQDATQFRGSTHSLAVGSEGSKGVRALLLNDHLPVAVGDAG